MSGHSLETWNLDFASGFTGFPVSRESGNWTFLLPSSTEEGRALGQPAPGWLGRRLRTEPTTRFVHKILQLSTKRLNDGPKPSLQTTPVPLSGTSPPDFRRGAMECPMVVPCRFRIHSFNPNIRLMVAISSSFDGWRLRRFSSEIG